MNDVTGTSGMSLLRHGTTTQKRESTKSKIPTHCYLKKNDNNKPTFVDRLQSLIDRLLVGMVTLALNSSRKIDFELE